MGGRGSSSMSSGQPVPDEEWNRRAREYLTEGIEHLESGKRNAAAEQLLTTTRAALSLVGSEKLEQMNQDDDITRISFYLRDWGHPFTGYGELKMLDDALTGYNRPLGSDKEEWTRFGRLVRSVNTNGFSNPDVAALLRFDEILNQYW